MFRADVFHIRGVVNAVILKKSNEVVGFTYRNGAPLGTLNDVQEILKTIAADNNLDLPDEVGTDSKHAMYIDNDLSTLKKLRLL